jgi:hypothetical protein
MITITTDGHLLQSTMNAFPTARVSSFVVNCVRGVETPDMITIITDGNILQTTMNAFPAATAKVWCSVVNLVLGVVLLL